MKATLASLTLTLWRNSAVNPARTAQRLFYVVIERLESALSLPSCSGIRSVLARLLSCHC